MKHIIYTKEREVARIQLNRPQSLNALNPEMIMEFRTLLKKIEKDDTVKVVVVAGAGRAFSAGVDIKTTSAEGFQKGGRFMKMGREVGEILENMPKVSIAQVHGYCFTGALELMLFFDMVFCTDDTQFGDTHAKWSIMPRWGMTQRLSRRVGLPKAKELSFRAMRVKGPEAERIGLVNRSFPSEHLESEVNKIIEEIKSNSFEAILAIKKLYNEGFHTTLAKGLELETNAEVQLSSTQEQLSKFKKRE